MMVVITHDEFGGTIRTPESATDFINVLVAFVSVNASTVHRAVFVDSPFQPVLIRHAPQVRNSFIPFGTPRS